MAGATIMSPTESAIKEKIDALRGDWGQFQIIAEIVAMKVFPEIAHHPTPFGRNEDGTTKPGWPDAYHALPDGRAVFIEANARAKPLGHLKNDCRKLQKMLQGGDLVAGVLFFCWAEDQSKNSLDELRKEIVGLGVPADKLHIIFSTALCAELRHPFYARLWAELGLPVTPSPFLLIKENQLLYDTTPQRIRPSYQDFVGGLVAKPGIFDDVRNAVMDGGALGHRLIMPQPYPDGGELD